MKLLRREDGQALVELAFVLPLLLLFLFAVIEFGLALNRQNSETDLANLAARTVSVIGTKPSAACSDGSNPTTLGAWVTCEAQATGQNAPGLSACVVSSGGTAAGDPIEIKVSSNFSWMGLLSAGGIVNPTSTITSSATMRLEQTATGSSFLSPTCS